jgi:hypothetical protein
LSQAIVVNGTTVAPAGSEVRGTVLSAVRSGRVKGRASLAIGFDRLRVGSETHQMQTVRVAQAAKSTVKRDAKRTGIAAGAGAVIGAIAGGGKGAAVGGAIGAGAGTGVAVSTRGDEVSLREGAIVTTKLRAPLTLQIPER